MKKRNLIKAGLDSLIPPQPVRKRQTTTEDLKELIAQAQHTLRPGRPAKHKKDRSAAEKGCKEGEARYSVILKKETIERLKAAAYWQRMTAKDTLTEAVEGYLKQYEKKHGPIKAVKA